MAEPRTYREALASGRFASFRVLRGETDLWVGVDRASFEASMPEALAAHVAELRAELCLYIAGRPLFLSSFEPLPDDRAAPRVARAMLRAAAAAGVGPMAAVAGAFSDAAAAFLRREYRCREILVENGGDDAIVVEEPVLVALLAGDSPLSGRLGVLAGGGGRPVGLATSAGRVGHSYSLGRADACAALAADAATADAFATAFANRIGSAADLGPALELAKRTRGLFGLAAVAGGSFGCVGALTVRPLAAGAATVGGAAAPGARVVALSASAPRAGAAGPVAAAAERERGRSAWAC